jgi:exodeoxyribonuclease VII large subunit
LGKKTLDICHSKIKDKRFFPLSAITTRVQQILQPHIGKLFWVKAEISSGRERGGSFYCDLVESNQNGSVIAQMRCTIWNRTLSGIRRQFKKCGLDLKLENGTLIGFQCCLQYHPQYGLSLKVVDADPAFALGEIELKKKEILNRLSREGLLEPNKRLFVPMLPQKIGLVTSKGSAAYNDVLKTFNSSGFYFKIILADSVVQGTKTEESVLTALDVLEKLELDLVIVARGGGSKTDLFWLDNEAIARRIAEYKYPVWTGIGHEIDISILDHVANRYFKTPTAVTEEIVARFVEMKRHLEEAKNRFKSTWAYRFDIDRKWVDNAKNGVIQGTRKLLDSTKSYLMGYAIMLSSKVQTRLSNEKSKLAVSRNLITTTPISLIKRASERLTERSGRFKPDRFLRTIRQKNEGLYDGCNLLLQKFKSQIQLRRERFESLAKRFKLESIISYLDNEKQKLSNKAVTLRAADPATSLKRGFSLVYSDDGTLINSLSQVKLEDILKTKVSDGEIVSFVEHIERK